MTDAAIAQWSEWHAARDRDLAEPNGWLTLVNFTWITDLPIRLKEFPGLWHVCDRDESAPVLVAEFSPDDDVTVDGEPAAGLYQIGLEEDESDFAIRCGNKVAERARRGGGYAVRVRDEDSPVRKAYTGVPIFDYDPAWKIPGVITLRSAPTYLTRYTAHPGVAAEAYVIADLDMTIDGKPVRLELEGSAESKFLLIFHDASNGETTADWRFLSIPSPFAGDVEAKAEGATLPGTETERAVMVDFNYALNFPAAFTPYGTCPRPLNGNSIDVPVEAGEKRPA